MQDYNQNFNKYANPLGAGASLWARLSPYISRLTSLFSKTAPKVVSRVTQDAKKIKDVAGKALSNTKEFGNDVLNAASSPHMLWVVPASYCGGAAINKGIEDLSNTYEGAKAIAEFNKEFEKATGRKPTTPETATYIVKLHQRNQELEAAAAGNKKQTSETVTPSQSKSDQFEIGKLFDISSPYAQYVTLPTTAGATLGGLLYGGKGSAIGGVGGLGLGLLAKYIADSQNTSTAKTPTLSA